VESGKCAQHLDGGRADAEDVERLAFGVERRQCGEPSREVSDRDRCEQTGQGHDKTRLVGPQSYRHNGDSEDDRYRDEAHPERNPLSEMCWRDRRVDTGADRTGADQEEQLQMSETTH
jgi:hypothetical protein